MAQPKVARDSLSADELASLVERVHTAGAVALKPVLAALTKVGRDAIVAAFLHDGLEVTEKDARVPLAKQLRSAVAAVGERGLPLAQAGKLLKGARSPAERKATIEEQLAAGTLALTVDGNVPRLLPASDALLSHAELDRLPVLVAALRDVIKRTQPKKGKPRVTIARAQLAALFAPPSNAPPARTALLDAFAGAATPTGLIRVPAIVGTLETAYSRAALLAALDELARGGAVELRPESGLARMTDEDRARCLAAYDGTPLSYARLIPNAERSGGAP